MKIGIIEFLLENDVVIKNLETKRMMTADLAESAYGEFVVYEEGNKSDLYRGDDFYEALLVLENNS